LPVWLDLEAVEISLPQEPKNLRPGPPGNKHAPRSSLQSWKEQEEDPAMSAQHSDKRGLAGEHPYTDIGQLVLFAVFLITWVTDSFLFRYSVFFAAHVSCYIRIPVGIAILVASALLALSAHKAVFVRPGREPGVISKGAFSFVRHPMYLGSWLFSAGLVIMTFSVSSAAVSMLMFLFYYLVASYEELLLVGKFGVEYRNYQARVPMFFPLKIGKNG
jgi:protein-S-isoprenylcysteine O-methyltransferase Ste14